MRSVGVKRGAALTLIAASFGERPERSWLAALEANDSSFSLTFVENRGALLGRARSLRPSIVMLPVQDARGVPSAPLIARLREHDPNVRVMVVLTPGASRAGLAEAIRAGGEATWVASREELLASLDGTRDPGLLSPREHDAVRALLATIRPNELRALVQFCVTHAHRRLSVGDVAVERGVSSGRLARDARARFWPTPSESIHWGRLLRASLLQWRESASLPTLAHASGFSGVGALRRSAARLLHKSPNAASELSPFLVSTLLHRRVQRMRLTSRG